MNRPERDMFEDKYSSFYDAYDPQRQQKREEIKRQRDVKEAEKRARLARKAKLRRKAFIRRAGALLVLLALILGILFGVRGCTANSGKTDLSSEPVSSIADQVNSPPENEPFAPVFTDDTAALGDDILSKNAILINVDKGTVAASKGGTERIRPASLVKVMTALVAVERLTDIKAIYTFDHDLLNPLYNSDLIMIGYDQGETATVDELFHGALMFSGADSTMALVDLAADSEEDFIRLMNEKAARLGLKDTHFDNAVGTDSGGLYSTCYDMAVIMQAALSNDYLRKVISTENYLLPANERHPDGIPLKNSMFAKMYGTEPEVAVIKGGKTGFTAKAGFCLVSWAEGKDGSEWIAVSTGADGSYNPIYDSFKLYKNYTSLTKTE